MHRPAVRVSITSRMQGDGFFARVWDLVRDIPPGEVLSYGDVARLLGVPRGARAVGWALRALPEEPHGIPWHRVLGAGGRITLPGPAGLLQARRLRAEGLTVVRGRLGRRRQRA
jgi:methylated-DNA-protein-cysteine methyltransferase-like protein